MIKYGLMSGLDTENTKAVFKAKKIAQKNVIFIEHLNNLIERLSEGDLLFAMNVNRFCSVSQLGRFGRYCKENGISLQFMEQPYLNIGNGKYWKTNIERHLVKIAELEIQIKNDLQKNIRMDNSARNKMFRDIEIQNLEIVSYTYASGGIMSKSS